MEQNDALKLRFGIPAFSNHTVRFHTINQLMKFFSRVWPPKTMGQQVAVINQ
jgi:hypothetical protein